VCLEAARIASQQAGLPSIVDRDFFERCLQIGEQAVRRALDRAVALTGVACGQAKVERVASNRRFVGPDGKLSTWRASSTRVRSLKSLPEGLVDPWLKTMAFYSGSAKVAAFHFYATHPISYYGDGRVTSDFVGLARKKRQRDDPGCLRIWFTGCAGDVAAGRYNDGSRLAKWRLTRRIYKALCESDSYLRPESVHSLTFGSYELLPMPRERPGPDEVAARIGDPQCDRSVRIFAAFDLAWRDRLNKKIPVSVASLQCNDHSVLSLPAECFVEYQLRAQEMRPGKFVAVAAYGDGGPWYIPTADAYPQGGYEIDRALCAPTIDPALTDSMTRLLSSPFPSA
jgi:hypothetical protein